MYDMASITAITDAELTRFFFALVCLLFSAHIFGYVFQRLKMPKVIGEITGGLLLGPTLLGHFFPNAYSWLFQASEVQGKLISAIYWIGLLLLMFISGFEIQRSVSKGDKKLITAILIGGTIVPFLGGWLLPKLYDFSPFLGPEQNMTAFTIILSIAIAVTSIPVISKIFIDLNLMNSRFAKIIVTTATIEDVMLWVLLAIATAMVSTESLSLTKILITVAITILFFAVSLLLFPKIVKKVEQSFIKNWLLSSRAGYTLLICFLFGALASLLKINIIFGAFLAGIIIGSIKSEKFDAVRNQIKEFSLAFFVPIYFAVVGLKLDLLHHFNPLFFILFLSVTMLLKTIGTVIAAKIVTKDWFSSLNTAIAMNTRGGPGIVLATIAFELGIINETFFVTLVLLAIITSLIAGYWFNLVKIKGWRLLNDESEPAKPVD